MPPSPPSPRRSNVARSPWGRLDVAMVALGLVANAVLALAVWPVLVRGGLVHDAVVWWRTTGTMVLLVPLLVVAAWCAVQRSVRAQIVARAISWSNLVVGTLIAVTHPLLRDRLLGSAIALGCVVALLALDGRDLGRTRRDDPFRPSRFRGSLLLALVMAFADAQTLTLTGLLRLPVGRPLGEVGLVALETVPVFVAAGVMAVAVWGLYRLSTWALLLNLVANVVIAGLALGGQLGVSLPVGVALASTAAIQAALPIPILVTAAGRRLPQRSGRVRLGWLVPAMLVFVGGFSVFAALGDLERTGWHTGADEAYLRGLRRGGPDGAGCSSPSFDDDGRPSLIDLKDMDLSGVELDGLCLDGVDLRGASLYHSRGRPWLGTTDLRGADLRGAYLVGVEFHGRLAGADLRGAALEGTRWHGSWHRPWPELSEVRFGTGARLRGADLRDADLRGVWLEEADLRDAELRGADLRGVDLRGADLRGATLPQLPLDVVRSIEWEGAVCPDGERAGELTGCAEHRATLPGELFDRDMLYVPPDAWEDWDCDVPSDLSTSDDWPRLEIDPSHVLDYFGRQWEWRSERSFVDPRRGTRLELLPGPDGTAVSIHGDDCGTARLEPVSIR